MTSRKIIKLFAGLVLTLALIVGLISINHPIILKWFSGHARLIGRPANVTVFTDGQVNYDIKVFHIKKYWTHSEKANNYLLSLKEFYKDGRLQYINVNLGEKWLGTPVGSSKKNYDIVLGHLFQSETGARFVPFHDDIKGFNFEPRLLFTDRQITFNVPPNTLKFDSVRIELQ